MQRLADDRAVFWRTTGLELDLCRARYSRYRFPRHTHPEFVVGLVERGTAWVESCSRRALAGEGRIVIHAPGDVHTGAAAGREPLLWRALYPPPALLETLGGGRRHHRLVFRRVIVEDSHFTRVFRRLTGATPAAYARGVGAAR